MAPLFVILQVSHFAGTWLHPANYFSRRKGVCGAAPPLPTYLVGQASSDQFLGQQ